MLLIFLLPIYGMSADTSVNINGNDKQVNFQTINSIVYIDIIELTNLLSSDASYELSKILLNKESLKFASGSLFVVYDNGIKLRVAQMSLPCIEKNDKLQIPWISFVNSMQGIGLLNFNSNHNKYYIVSDIFKNQNKSKKETIVNDEAKSIAKDTTIKQETNSVIHDYIEFPDNTSKTKIIDSVKNPMKYTIPKGLVK
jgi:hypothetical protein